MTMTTMVAQLRISRESQNAECALDNALIQQSQLFGTARRDISAGAFAGHDALVQAAA